MRERGVYPRRVRGASAARRPRGRCATRPRCPRARRRATATAPPWPTLRTLSLSLSLPLSLSLSLFSFLFSLSHSLSLSLPHSLPRSLALSLSLSLSFLSLTQKCHIFFFLFVTKTRMSKSSSTRESPRCGDAVFSKGERDPSAPRRSRTSRRVPPRRPPTPNEFRSLETQSRFQVSDFGLCHSSKDGARVLRVSTPLFDRPKPFDRLTHAQTPNTLNSKILSKGRRRPPPKRSPAPHHTVYRISFFCLKGRHKVSNSDDQEFQRLEWSVTLQKTLQCPRPTPSQPLSNTNGI